jgi:L-threonylcarbamoyladenylate synthase
MKLLKLEEVNKKIVSQLKKSVFIYPTDTIYGIGCDAENDELVEKIRNIKKRDKKPFSVIAPNIRWIKKNCEVDKNTLKKYLPGAYTLLLKKKNKDFLKNISDNEYLGVRIPDHPMTKILQKTRKPIVTTSVNLSKEKFANSLQEINPEISDQVDFIIDAGKLSGKPSTLIKNGKIIER